MNTIYFNQREISYQKLPHCNKDLIHHFTERNQKLTQALHWLSSHLPRQDSIIQINYFACNS
jgi:hypothetical protein